ncbi:MAG: acetyl-CoA carboxylase biotin carboxyl carrier protein, partial [Thermoguttaceae bacterium]
MGGTPSNQDVFDVRRIRRLIELMNEHDLQEMDLRQGDTRIQLRRAGEPLLTGVPVVSSAPMPVPAAAAPAAVPVPASANPAAPAVDANMVLIKSPMVGTFYSAPDPNSTPYVKVGDPIGKETTVCIVEAMKVFNEIQAEVSGTVVAILVENGEPVERSEE